ncbi:hypothetical protein RchiOBHm_Chr6g0307201 [Rosa chinensis]|uniref:Uncharacterized protein n=1 Tax=Rosa chinensis TaxID=74649 RepID=A0A2P6Q0A5_ROSCH|nr:hypothetical protein RchiOBHm_Chr6g0307201 [Rosa chinensis]
MHLRKKRHLLLEIFLRTRKTALSSQHNKNILFLSLILPAGSWLFSLFQARRPSSLLSPLDDLSVGLISKCSHLRLGGFIRLGNDRAICSL